MQDSQLKISITFISSIFTIISTIKKLENRGLSITEVIDLLNKVKTVFKHNYDQIYYQKFKSVFGNNKGFSTIKDVSRVLNNGPIPLQEMTQELAQLSLLDMEKLNYAPLVSCDVERVFSEYKTVLTDNRSFLYENFKKYVIIKCNRKI